MRLWTNRQNSSDDEKHRHGSGRPGSYARGKWRLLRTLFKETGDTDELI